jgi:hypothetical protein
MEILSDTPKHPQNAIHAKDAEKNSQMLCSLNVVHYMHEELVFF